MDARVWTCVTLTLILAGCGGKSEAGREVEAVLQATVTASSTPAYVTADAEGKRLWKETRAFYERREYAPAWIEGTAPRRQMGDLIEALRAADADGLDPDLYGVGVLEDSRERASEGFLAKRGFEPAQAGALDVWLTYLYLRYASDLARGVWEMGQADSRWQIRPDPFDAAAHLEEALDRNRVQAALLELRPDLPQYEALRKALAEYRAAAAEGGWPELPRQLRLQAGHKTPDAAKLAARLAASGDYRGRVRDGGDGGDGMAFDDELQEAVRKFQRRHGLAADGVVGGATLSELNVPIEKRISQIELNLERWRWVPRTLGNRYILVNIPEYHLEVWDGERVALEMRVVVGRPDTQTPIFSDAMSYLVFSPYWNVPPGIAEGETLPAVLKDPGFLARNDMEVLDAGGKPMDPAEIDLEEPEKYRFRQRPGRQNALGLVKFMFPNEHHVYLHDTPANSLFDRVGRSFSHGCVRVEAPVQLAEYLLRDQSDWTTARIEEAMHSGEERTVKLREPVPVFLGYWTARVAQDGELQFRQDIYGVDRRQAKLLADRLGRLRRIADKAVAAIQAAEAATPRSTD